MFRLIAKGKSKVHLLRFGSLEELTEIVATREVVWLDGEACSLDIW